MRVWLTGGTGFVGSNIVHVALERGDEVMTTVHTFRPSSTAATHVPISGHDRRAAVSGQHRAVSARPRHPLRDPQRLRRPLSGPAGGLGFLRHRRLRSTAAAAAEVGAAFVVISTDWVFDGTQSGADEDTPPNPINLYGVLKLASELVALGRGGAVARISGVNGLHRARPSSPRQQDPGFGYFVLSLVDSLRRGQTFTVWEADNINMIATPSLASDSADQILEIGRRRLTGVFHCCGRRRGRADGTRPPGLRSVRPRPGAAEERTA